MKVKLGKNIVPHVSKFRYLKSIIQDGEISEDARHKILEMT